MTSPLRYPGGKTRACKIIETVILEHFDKLYNYRPIKKIAELGILNPFCMFG